MHLPDGFSVLRLTLGAFGLRAKLLGFVFLSIPWNGIFSCLSLAVKTQICLVQTWGTMESAEERYSKVCAF